MSLAIAGAVMSHQFGLIHVGLFLICGETVRFIKSRRLDVPIFVAIAGGLIPLIITLPLARQSV